MCTITLEPGSFPRPSRASSTETQAMLRQSRRNQASYPPPPGAPRDAALASPAWRAYG